MEGLTLLVRQVVTVIVDDQFQLSALRQLGRFVEMQSSVLLTRAQRGHVMTVRPPTTGWHADRENGYGRASSDTAAYAFVALTSHSGGCVFGNTALQHSRAHWRLFAARGSQTDGP